MKKLFLTLSGALFTLMCSAQTDVPPYAAGPYPGGSLLTFSSGGATMFIQEGWGLNIGGDNLHPVKVPAASLAVGYDSANQDFGIGNLFVKGNVGIGTLSPKEALSVNGNIRCRQVKVETANWPDYVFRPTYVLTPLSELRAFIEANHHLPDVPTEGEIERSGQNLGEMNKVLLKKIEDLTLYLLEKNDQDEKLELRLLAQQKAIDLLTLKVSQLTRRSSSK